MGQPGLAGPSGVRRQCCDLVDAYIGAWLETNSPAASAINPQPRTQTPGLAIDDHADDDFRHRTDLLLLRVHGLNVGVVLAVNSSLISLVNTGAIQDGPTWRICGWSCGPETPAADLRVGGRGFTMSASFSQFESPLRNISMLRLHGRGGLLVMLSWFTLCLVAADAPQEGVYDDPAKVDADFTYQGEYSGLLGADKAKYGVQVIAKGAGKFHALGLPGGLPGDGWSYPIKLEADGVLKDGSLEFGSKEGKAVLKGNGLAQIFDGDGDLVGELKRVDRESHTLGAKPPASAIVLFDGKSADQFEGGRVTANGLLKEGVTSKLKFGSCLLHLEFRLPYMPLATGQGRRASANSRENRQLPILTT